MAFWRFFPALLVLLVIHICPSISAMSAQQTEDRKYSYYPPYPTTMEEVQTLIAQAKNKDAINTIFDNGWSMLMLAILWNSSLLSEMLQVEELDIFYQIPPLSPESVSLDTLQVRKPKHSSEKKQRKSHRKVTIDRNSPHHEREAKSKSGKNRLKASAVKSDGHNPFKIRKRSEDKAHSTRHRSMPTYDSDEFETHPDRIMPPEMPLVGFNALHIAVWARKRGAITQIINSGYGALLIEKNAAGDTPLHLAIKLRDIETTKQLLADPLEGAEIGLYQFYRQQAFAICNDENLQPVFTAVALIKKAQQKAGHVRINVERDAFSIIELLLDAGNTILIRYDGKNLFSLIKEYGHSVLLAKIFSLGFPLYGMKPNELRAIQYINNNARKFEQYIETYTQDPRFPSSFGGATAAFVLTKGLVGPNEIKPKVDLAGTQAQQRRKSSKLKLKKKRLPVDG